MRVRQAFVLGALGEGQGIRVNVLKAEEEVSFSHKNREWEFGSKLGFIAGLGFKVNVTY